MKIRFQHLIILLTLTFATINSNAQSGWEQVYSGEGWLELLTFVPGSDNLWKTGWAVSGYDEIIKTTDGGDTWTVYTQTEATWVNGIHFFDEDTGLMCTANGQIVKSTDGGETWTMLYENSNEWFGQMAFKDNMNGVIVGTPCKYTSDGGVTWTNGTSTFNLDRVTYGGGNTYFAAGVLSMKTAKSTDNGANWVENYNTFEALDVITAFDEDNVMTGGTAFKVIYTSDGGTTWEDQELNNGQLSMSSAAYFDADTAYVGGVNKVYKTTDSCNTWTEDTAIESVIHRFMFVTPLNVLYTVGDPTQIWRKIGPPPLDPDFEADNEEVCEGSSLNFTDLSYGPIDAWYWEFEGGTPATSTDQNPTVTYSTAGVYDVKLVVSIGDIQDSLVKTDYINVVVLPVQVDMPSGATTLCSNEEETYTTNEVQYASEYEWEITPSEAGMISWEMNEAILTAADDWSGDFLLKVRGVNACGNGDWSDEFEGTIYQGPQIFSVEGGGGYCQDGDGVEITLNGSETGIDYELYHNSIATGNIVEGTDSEISFGMITDEGFYTVDANNENCIAQMQEQVEVSILLTPEQPATPSGPIAVCDESSSVYESEGSEGANSYTWSLLPEEAGTISGDGLEATVLWNSEFTGLATVSLAGINDCGEGDYSESLEVAVGATIPEIIGADMVCDFSEEIYEVTDNEGSTYTWEVTGGTITEGQGTHMITLAWSGEGNGTIIVDEENENGCEGSSDLFDVLIDDCTVIDENAIEGLKIYPNPATSQLNISFISGDDQTGEIIIYNQVGQLVMSKNIQATKGIQTLEVNISHLTNGIYLMKIQSGVKSIATRRFIKN